MIRNIAIAGLWFSAISFGLFFIAVLVHLFGRKSTTKGAGAGLGEATEQHGLPEGVAKVIEAFAKVMETFGKLADVLNRSGPIVLTLMASIIFFVLALFAATVDAFKSEAPQTPKAAISPAIQFCLLNPFDPGQRRLADGFKGLKQTPDQCTQSLLEEAEKGAMLFVIGHADRQPLSGRRLRYYGTNEALAYQRALEVKRVLLDDYKAAAIQTLKPDQFTKRIVALAAGSSYLDRHADAEQLAHDRSVEIVSFQIDNGNSQEPLR